MKNLTLDNCYVIVNENYKRIFDNIFTSEKKANRVIKEYNYNKYNSYKQKLIAITLESYMDLN